MNEPEPGPMCLCGSTERVAWSPLWHEFVCEPCRIGRVDRLLKQDPVTAIPVPPS